MATLATVQDYVTAARVLLQDTVATYRYPDADILAALNFAMIEARRARPDFFIGTTVPSFSTVNSDAVNIDEQYRLPVLLFVAGYAQLRDDEGTQDQRASTLMAIFKTSLVSL